MSGSDTCLSFEPKLREVALVCVLLLLDNAAWIGLAALIAIGVHFI